ncbi:MAG: DUF3853 family protein [Bacteroidales bacterium]
MENQELQEIIKNAILENLPPKQPTYVYGQKGIAELFHCSIPTASRILASGKIAPAVSQIGRKIVVDVDMALFYSKQKNGGRKWKK